MFQWFTSGSDSTPGMAKMREEFRRMLTAGRHTFDTAANALLGGTDHEVIRDEIFETDQAINDSEQQIRREIVVHATVHGAAAFPGCLVLMSVVKDAERLGDYAKNILELSEMVKEWPPGELRNDLVDLKSRISHLIEACDEAFSSQDAESAQEQVGAAGAIQRRCDEQVRRIVEGDIATTQPAGFVLAYRYFKRVASHTRNVLTSIIQPVDKLDFTS